MPTHNSQKISATDYTCVMQFIIAFCRRNLTATEIEFIFGFIQGYHSLTKEQKQRFLGHMPQIVTNAAKAGAEIIDSLHHDEAESLMRRVRGNLKH